MKNEVKFFYADRIGLEAAWVDKDYLAEIGYDSIGEGGDGMYRPRCVPVILLLLMALLSGLATGGCGGKKVQLKELINLSGLSLEEARRALEEEGFILGETREVFSDTVVAGQVISSSPPAGEKLEEGTSVDLVVSKGPEMVIMPAVIGVAEAQALALLNDLGFQVQVARSYHESIAEGLVCASTLPQGASFPKGTLVTITVSQGSAYTACSRCGGTGKVTLSKPCEKCGGDGLCDT